MQSPGGPEEDPRNGFTHLRRRARQAAFFSIPTGLPVLCKKSFRGTLYVRLSFGFQSVEK